MRLKNLTITLTLTCLSIVAITGLVLLPISKGICELYESDWYSYDGGYSANYYAQENVDNESWYLLGDVQAKGVKASGSVHLLNPDRYNKNWKHTGSANLLVVRDNYTRILMRFTKIRQFIPGDADSNVVGNPGFKLGRHTDITLDIKIREVKYKLLYGETKKKKLTVTAEVGVNYGFVAGESTFLYGSEVIIAKSISLEKTRNEVANEANTSAWEVSVAPDPDELADSRASASLNFSGASTSKKVEYKAPDSPFRVE